jgi:hypothetical protein
MPEINAYADVFRDWDGLLGACDRNLDLLPGVDTLKLDLESFRDSLRGLKLEQEHLTAHRLATTQQLLQTLDGGREAARKLRSFIITRLGSRSELLTQFGIRVNRSRRVSRKSKTEPTSTEPTPTPTPGPEAQAQAQAQPPAGTGPQPPSPTGAKPAEPSTITTTKEETK